MIDQDIIDELTARADAATKLAMVSLEFQMNMAKALGLSLDLMGAANALVSTEALDGVDKGTFEIEHQSRRRAAAILRTMAEQA